jgi:outer membrane protein assembly factor BamD
MVYDIGNLLYGMAARMVLRHRYTAKNRTTNNKLITIRAATPYTGYQKTKNIIGFRTAAYLIFLGFLFISCGTRQVLTPLDPEDEFERAMSFFENKKYDTAVQAFERILFYHPSSEYVDDAQYWLGRTYFEKTDYTQAIAEFDYLIQNFSSSVSLEEAYLYRAKSYLLKAPGYEKDPTEIENAISLFDQFLTRFPNSKYTDEIRDLILSARDRLAKKEVENGKTYLKLSKYDAALLYFDFVIENYPETEACKEAKYHAAELYEKKGQTEEALKLLYELLEEENWKEKAEKKIEEIEKDSQKIRVMDAG